MVFIRHAVILSVVGHTPSLTATCSTYVGTFDARFLPDGRQIELLSTLIFRDRSCLEWIAPQGSIVDGASIPKFFWSLLGGPYEGKYRDASAIHDVACQQRGRPWAYVHLAFHEAMLVSGVEKWRARMMYTAVYHFGPRWDAAGSHFRSAIEPSATEQKQLKKVEHDLKSGTFGQPIGKLTTPGESPEDAERRELEKIRDLRLGYSTRPPEP